jgi:hypothetical protein
MGSGMNTAIKNLLCDVEQAWYLSKNIWSLPDWLVLNFDNESITIKNPMVHR